MSDFRDMMRAEAYEAEHYKIDRYAKPRREAAGPPNRADDPNRRVGRMVTRRCPECAGTGEGPLEVGHQCTNCGGEGVEEVRT